MNIANAAGIRGRAGSAKSADALHPPLHEYASGASRCLSILGTPYSAMLRRNERKIFKAPLA